MLKIQTIYVVIVGVLLVMAEWLSGGPANTLRPLASASITEKALLLPVVGAAYVVWCLWIGTVAGAYISLILLRGDRSEASGLLRFTRVLPVIALGVVIAHGVVWALATSQSPVRTPQATVVVTAQAGVVAMFWNVLASAPFVLLWLHGTSIERKLRHAAGPTCPSCGYSLLGLEGSPCPECGRTRQ